jgi:hypothetical protein
MGTPKLKNVNVREEKKEVFNIGGACSRDRSGTPL